MPTYWGGAFPDAAAGAGGGGSKDLVAPTVTLISPAAPGGFGADWITAKDTPIIYDVTDAVPGLGYVTITALLPGGAEQTVYRRGAFQGDYAGVSSTSVITNGLRFTIRNQHGWPPGGLTLNVDVVDGDGNLAP